MNRRPRVSVLVPVFNAAATVRRAVDSIRGQTLRDLEILLVDDGSTDGSPEILVSIAREDPSVRVIRRPHQGLVAALNAGLAEANGRFLARMDADDESLPERLEVQIAMLESDPELAAVSCRILCVPRDRITRGMLAYEAWLNRLLTWKEIAKEAFVESPLVHPSVTLRTSALLSAGGWRDGPFPEDYDLWLRLLRDGWRLAKTPCLLFHWRDSPGRLTRTDPRYSPAAFRRLKAFHLARGVLAGASEVQIWGAGRDGRPWFETLAGEGLRVVRYFDVDPRKVGSLVRGKVPVLHWSEAARWKGTPLLCAVGVAAAKPLIRANLADLGFREGSDWWFVQ